MSNDSTTRIDETEAAQPVEGRSVVASGAYRKPELRRLGSWNVFTRAQSETSDQGFFDFEVKP